MHHAAMSSPMARRGPAPRISDEGWASYRDGQVARCPGYNSRTHHLCDTALGVVAPGRRLRVRVRPVAGGRTAPATITDLLPRCRRCGNELELAFDRLDVGP
ncbi:MAG: hypothetical protein ABS52_19500 [Gemmatimonadetes bacterium SCN 70-22]|nr:MAG: hypothetical protein ABS52_19500 [Gemmatimonadetes bacterium SCN 70-22]